jgi:hypothetical protein
MTTSPSDDNLLLTVMLPVEAAWPVKLQVINSGMAALFSKGRLHSVGTVGRADDRHVYVPLIQWANLRTVGDSAHVPTSVYAERGDGLYYVNWGVTSAITYVVVEDDVFGAAIKIPMNELKKVEAKTK